MLFSIFLATIGLTAVWAQNGDTWYYAFMRRHPNIKLRVAAALGHDRASVNKEAIESWFANLEAFLRKEWGDVWEDMFRDPRRLLNADESGFPLSTTSGKVLAPQGTKHVYQLTNSDKTQITTICCFSAMGNFAPPMIIFPGQRIRDVGLSDFPGAIYGVSETGWMTSDLFVSYLHHLKTFILSEKIPLPVILFIDGHSTHITLAAATFCHENQIILYCLLAHATHILQPCDVSFFSPLKAAWKAESTKWKMDNLGEPITKKVFPLVFRAAFDKVASLEIAASGFRRCGLFPLNPENIDATKLGPSKNFVANKQHNNEEDNSNIQETMVNVSGEHTDHSPAVLASTSKNAIDEALPVMKNCASSAISLPSRDPNFVSPAFELLRVPELKKKKTLGIRLQLPKAVSGHEALRMLTERENHKKEEEEAKIKRKEEREQRREERKIVEEEKAKKREEKKLQKEKNKKDQQKRKNTRKQKKTKSVDSSEDEEDIPYVESDSEMSENGFACAGCHQNNDEATMIGCDICPAWWHPRCTRFFADVDDSQIEDTDFICDICQQQIA